MKRLFLVVMTVLALQKGVAAQNAGIDTIYVSDKYTTHLIYGSELSYEDISSQRNIAAKVIEESKDKLAIAALSPFAGEASLFVEETNGKFHSYVIRYREEPRQLIYDERVDAGKSKTLLETIKLTSRFTTHLIFDTDVIYADISRPDELSAHLVESGKNKLALKAKAPFKGRGSISVAESNGYFRTFYVEYAENPETLAYVVKSDDRQDVYTTTNGRRFNAPNLKTIMEKQQTLYHISSRQYKIRFTVENIWSYSDVIYMTLRVDNNSGVSFVCPDATFVMENYGGSRRKPSTQKTIFPKNRLGQLDAAPGQSGRICYSFDKFSLSSDQKLKVYLYEENGNRNIVLTLSEKDINSAIAPM